MKFSEIDWAQWRPRETATLMFIRMDGMVLLIRKLQGMGAGLIVAIGAQNAFVLSQSIRKNHHWAVAGLCAVLDVTLIAAGVGGLGMLIASNEWLQRLSALGGALFLINKLIGDQVSRFASVQYSIQGPWTDPKITFDKPFEKK